MPLIPKSISRVIESFQRLPGVGPKTAQRLAFYLLHVPQTDLDRFAESLQSLRRSTVLCSVCKNVSESDPCPICNDQQRDQMMVCVVEQPTDVVSIEKTGKYRGVYHVLHGAIDPLNNIGPDEIYLDDLIKRVNSPTHPVSEVILATNPNMEGEATALYIQKKMAQTEKPGREPAALTRLAHGLPVGADIEYADEVTLSRALEGRRKY